MGIHTKKSDGSQEPLQVRYDRFEKAIAGNEEYRESLLGADVLATAHPRYFEISVMLACGYTLSEWENLPLRKRGELVAVKKINNMIEVLERHTLETHRKQREHGSTNKNMFTTAGEGRGQEQSYWNGTDSPN